MILWLIACQFSSEPPAEVVGAVGVTHPVVALITIDTWRSDHLSEAHTPAIWSLAQEGERYTQAFSPMGLTTPAHATMLTGMSPWEHGLEGNNHHGYALKDDVSLLPERFEGWASGAFVSAYPAGPAGGLDKGWDRFDGPEVGERSGEVAVQAALDWLPTDRPALLWVHVYEPHGPYLGSGMTERARYAEEVRRADAIVAPLLERLRDRGATIVVTSDHGEVLDEERCSYQHERSISDHVLHVPMVRWSPGIVPRVTDDLIGLSDVPALLEGAAVAPRKHWLAQSGMCEADCAPGCSPVGLSGRDAVVIDPGGKWVERPGRGRFSLGKPSPQNAALLAQIPGLKEAESEATDQAKSLGYITPD